MATRTSSGQVDQAIATKVPNLDRRRGRPLPLHRRIHQGRRRHSAATNFLARNVHYGIREHGMGAILRASPSTRA